MATRQGALRTCKIHLPLVPSLPAGIGHMPERVTEGSGEGEIAAAVVRYKICPMRGPEACAAGSGHAQLGQNQSLQD